MLSDVVESIEEGRNLFGHGARSALNEGETSHAERVGKEAGCEGRRIPTRSGPQGEECVYDWIGQVLQQPSGACQARLIPQARGPDIAKGRVGFIVLVGQVARETEEDVLGSGTLDAAPDGLHALICGAGQSGADAWV